MNDFIAKLLRHDDLCFALSRFWDCRLRYSEILT